MRGEGLGFRGGESRALLEKLNRAVDGLGNFDVFKAGAEPGRVEPKARGAAFEFAVAYGECLIAGMELETEPYVPAEILGSVAQAAAAALYEEVRQLEKLSSRLSIIVKRTERAREICDQFMQIVAAYRTIEIAMTQYHQLVLTMAPPGQRLDIESGHPILREGRVARAAYVRAQELMISRAWWLQRYIGIEYWNKIRPFLDQD